MSLAVKTFVSADTSYPAPRFHGTSLRSAPSYTPKYENGLLYGRGGWYADMPWWKDPSGHTGRLSSAWALLPQHQHLPAGDVLLRDTPLIC